MNIKTFEAADFQSAYNSAIERKMTDPDFSAKVWAMAQKEVNAEIRDTVDKTDSWLREYIEKVLDPSLAESRIGQVYTKLLSDPEQSERNLGNIAKVLTIILCVIGSLCALL